MAAFWGLACNSGATATGPKAARPRLGRSADLYVYVDCRYRYRVGYIYIYMHKDIDRDSDKHR